MRTELQETRTTMLIPETSTLLNIELQYSVYRVMKLYHSRMYHFHYAMKRAPKKKIIKEEVFSFTSASAFCRQREYVGSEGLG